MIGEKSLDNTNIWYFFWDEEILDMNEKWKEQMLYGFRLKNNEEKEEMLDEKSLIKVTKITAARELAPDGKTHYINAIVQFNKCIDESFIKEYYSASAKLEAISASFAINDEEKLRNLLMSDTNEEDLLFYY